MSEPDREKFYDQEIAPALLNLAKRCEAMGMPFVACVQFGGGRGDGEVGTTRIVPDDACHQIRWADFAARSRGNIDGLVMAIMKEARVRGHSSLVLHQLGVPESPTP